VPGGDSAAASGCANSNVCPPQIRYFRNTRDPTGVEPAGAAEPLPRLSICLIAGAALQASIKYALPQRAGNDAIAWG
jgi:hypothetical protein